MIELETESGMADTMAAKLAGVTQAGGEASLSDARQRVRASLFGEEPSRPKRTIGRFTLLQRLGEGAMGEVFAAHDPELARKVALKLVHRDRSDSEAARARLLREAQAMARLSHPNVVTVYESGTHEGRVFIAMELVAGVDLRALFSGEHTWRRVVEVYRDAARGLAAAHAVGLIHRDFKPENVMIGEDGRVRVLDFGVARAGDDWVPASDSQGTARGDLLTHELTHTGVLLGTPAYMAPEQFTTGETSARSDQFSYCVALYECLYGRRPFVADNLRELMEAHRAEARVPARSEVPRAVAAVVLRGLKADPSARFPSMDAVVAALDRCLAERRRRQRQLALGGLTGGALIAGYVVAAPPLAGDPCVAGEAAIAAVWNPERAAALAEGFSRSGTTDAMQIWQRIAARVDDYTGAWARGHADACEAGKITGEQARRVAELRMACLSDARRELDETLKVLARAEPGVIFRGVQAIADLPPLARCADSEALLAAVPVPADPQVAVAVEAIRARATEARALRRAGLSARALDEVARLVVEAAAVDHAPLRAELDLLAGQLEIDTARFDAAATTLERGFWSAVDSGHDEVAARAAVALAGLVGGRQAALEVGLGWARAAEALIRRAHLSSALAVALRRSKAQLLRVAGQPERARGELDAAMVALRAAPEVDELDAAALLRELAGVALDQGKPEEAAELIEQALGHARAAFGEQHPEVGRALRLLGNSFYFSGRREEALRTYEEARRIAELAHGPDHPEVGDALNGVGATLDELGRDDEALAAYETSLAIRRKHLGENHPDVAGSLGNIAVTLAKLGRHAEAERVTRQAGSILRAVHGEQHPEIATNLLHLANLAHVGGRHAEAAELAREAVAMFTASLGPEHPDVAYALSALAFILLDANEPLAALEPARRALALRTRANPDPLLVAESQLRLGEALWLSGQDRDEARELLRAARAGYAAQAADRVAGIDKWLVEQGVEK
ncbi:tetratricopeptide repeat protein [Nannocystis sp. SCPEA4]|uniref:serine/threonine-protein kinase n=1 Tax=Nannocystis sp. SCPEA4 TaxID=2996787 RepID=UPI002271E3AD|nr:tetratricopeptide repeat protein [Nannocystis sp. SCPEA4]